MRYHFLIAIPGCLLLSLISSAQNKTTAQPLPGYIFRHIDNTKGLLNNDVASIAQDPRGYMWIGTRKGLQRYDGLRFVNYNDTSDIPGGDYWISALYPGAKNNSIWLVKPEVKALNLVRNAFFSPDVKKIGKTNGDNYTCWNGKTWTLHRNYGSETNKEKGKTTGYLLLSDPTNTSDYFVPFSTDSLRNEIWIASRYGWLLFDGKTRKVYSKDNNSISHPLLALLDKMKIRSLTMDSRGNIWLINWAPFFYCFNTATGQLHTYSLSNILQSQGKRKIITGTVNVILEDNHGVVWLGTTNAGLLQYNYENNTFNSITTQQGTGSGIRYNFGIYCLFQDRDENIWVGTDKGISIFNPHRQYFSIIQHDEYNTQSLPKSEVNALIETAAGDLLIGTWGGGISVYDKQLRFKKTISFPAAIPKNEIWGFVQNDDGTIWAGCQYGWIHIIDPGKLSLRTVHPPELDSSTIRCMKKDISGNIWLGLHNGKIIQWNKEHKKFIPFHYRSKADSLLAPPVIELLIDRSRNFWVSTWNGFKQYDSRTQKFTASYLPDRKNSASISSALCHGIEEYNDSTLLIGTEDGGLNLFDKNTKAFSQPVSISGKSPSSVYAIKKDQRGNVWFTSNYAIYKLNPLTNKFIIYSPGDGVINSLFTGRYFLAARSGQWFTWTYEKVVGFYPANINEQQQDKTPVTITGFKVFDQPLSVDSLFNTGKLVTLSYKQNFLNIEFAAIQFSVNQQTNYYYKLSGVDKEWVPSGTKQFASYTDLQPGEYMFSVKTESEVGVSPPTSFSIVVLPPFWQTWWFRTLCISLIGCSSFWLLRKRIKGIKHEAEMKQKIAETEMMALRAQMNPHFIFNCLNAIDNMIQTNQKEKATLYLSRFAKLIRSVLDSSKNNVVPLHKDVETLKLYLELEQFRCGNKFQYHVEVDDELLHGDYKIPPLIIQPFVENSIHHGLLNKQAGEKKLWIKASLQNSNVLYTVTDNGVGRVRAAQIKNLNRPEHLSYGIQITAERIHLHNGNGRKNDMTITDLLSDGQPIGTRVEVQLKTDQ